MKDGCIRNVFTVTALASACLVIVVIGSVVFTHKLLTHNDYFPKDISCHLLKPSRRSKLSAVFCIKQQAGLVSKYNWP